MTTKNAVLIGHNFNSILGLARALGRCGYAIYVIRTGVNKQSRIKRIGQIPEASSKYINKYRIVSAQDVSGIIKVLTKDFADNNRKSVLIPVDDICAEIVDEHMTELFPYYFMPNVYNTPGGVIKLMDKYYQKQIAREAGLPVPNGWSIVIKNGQYNIPDGIKYPCFAKTQTPIPARKKYMGKSKNEEELVALLDRVAAYRDCIMLIEEYIEIEKEFGTVGVCNRGKVCIPAITEKVVLGHGSNAGVTACGKIHDPDDYSETAKKMELLMSKTGFQGMFDIDLYESKGIMYFNELNVRVGAEGIGTMIAGVNLPKMFCDGFSKEGDMTDYSQKAKAITFANEKPLISDWAEGFLSWREYRNILNYVDRLYIYDTDDIGPYRSFKLHVARQFVRKLLRKG